MSIGAVIGLIFLPTIAAFLLLIMTPVWKFHFKKAGSGRLVLWVLVTALFLNLLSAFLWKLVGGVFASFTYPHSWPFLNILGNFFIGTKYFIMEIFQSAFPNMDIDPVSVISLIIVTACIVLSAVWKKFFFASYERYYLKRKTEAIREMELGGAFSLEGLFLHSLDQFTPIMVNLRCGKVYIGCVIAENVSEYSSSKENTISLFLLASGYRDKNTLEFILTNNYEEIVITMLHNEEEATLKDYFEYGLIIPVNEIVSATPWVKDIYRTVITKKSVPKPKSKPKSRSKSKSK